MWTCWRLIWCLWVLKISNNWCQPGNFILSCLVWHACLDSFANTRQVEPTAQIRVWNVYRNRKMQKEHSRKPDPCRPLLMSTAWGGHEWSWGRKKRAGLFLEPGKHQGNGRMQKRKTIDDNCWWESHVHAKNCVLICGQALLLRIENWSYSWVLYKNLD